jgi:hypothetical protein
MNRWHAANKKSDEKAKKAKSKDNPADCSASRRSDFSTPRTNTEHEKDIRVDELPDLDDASLKFQYRKNLLPDWALRDCPSFMRRFHNWYKRACILGLKTIYAPQHRMYSDLRDNKSLISCSILKICNICSASNNLLLKWFDSGACKCLIDTNLIYIIT